MLEITGNSVVTSSQMQAYLKKVNPDGAEFLQLCSIFLEEGKTEGIRGDVAFAQSLLETGNFTFKGSAVTPDQHNYAGMGVLYRGMKGNSFDTARIGIRAQIQHLKAYANTKELVNECVDPRFSYVTRGSAQYVEWLGIQENPRRLGWASGAGYGEKIINILNKIKSAVGEYTGPQGTESEVDTMKINTEFISTNNSYESQTPKYIVIHETDNFAASAGARVHAKAQYNGNYKGASAHVFVDDVEAYQAMSYERGAWHVGVDYGGKLFGTVNNRNSIGIEKCVNDGCNYEKAFQNTVDVCKQLMAKYGIPADRVVSHYDVCNKNCPSQIRKNNDWDRFKRAIVGDTSISDAISPFKVGSVGSGVVELQNNLNKLGYSCGTADGIFGKNTESAVKKYQTSKGLECDGIAGLLTLTAISEDIKRIGKIESDAIKYRVQCGAFKTKEKAQELVDALAKAGFSAIIKEDK